MISKSKPMVMFSLIAFVAILLFGLQFWIYRHIIPAPDSVAYMEVADQIHQVGYIQAQSGHWSPLYPLFLYAMKSLFGFQVVRELILALALQGILFGFILVLGGFWVRAFIRYALDESRSDFLKLEKAISFFVMSFLLYLTFGFSKLSLLMPDVWVLFWMMVLSGQWMQVWDKGYSWKRGLGIGFVSALAYWTRSSLMPWSFGSWLVALFLCPKEEWSKKIRFFVCLAVGFVFVASIQLTAVRLQKGFWSIGGGKVPLVEIYGATFPKGVPSWPLSFEGGALRVYTESRKVSFPGFYEPGREYDEAVIPYDAKKCVRAFFRATQSLLFGFWSPSHGWFWSLMWIIFPMLLFARVKSQKILDKPLPRLGVFFVLGGLGGVAMHLASFLAGFYLMGYVWWIVMGMLLITISTVEWSMKNHLGKALKISAWGLVAFCLFSSMALYRKAHTDLIGSGIEHVQKIATYLKTYSADSSKGLRVAVVGDWVGLYSIRLGGAQVYADIPRPTVLNQKDVWERLVRELRSQGVRVVLCRDRDLPIDHSRWIRVDGTGFWVYPIS